MIADRKNRTMPKPRFLLGRVVITPGAIEALSQAHQQPGGFLIRHVTGDRGDLGDHDRLANDDACRFENEPDRRDRILSAYMTKLNERIWIITEWDRSATTILLPDEY
jgi:hypothetical protein